MKEILHSYIDIRQNHWFDYVFDLKVKENLKEHVEDFKKAYETACPDYAKFNNLENKPLFKKAFRDIYLFTEDEKKMISSMVDEYIQMREGDFTAFVKDVSDNTSSEKLFNEAYKKISPPKGLKSVRIAKNIKEIEMDWKFSNVEEAQEIVKRFELEPKEHNCLLEALLSVSNPTTERLISYIDREIEKNPEEKYKKIKNILKGEAYVRI